MAGRAAMARVLCSIASALTIMIEKKRTAGVARFVAIEKPEMIDRFRFCCERNA
jgi:hypothetical protein